MDYSPHHESGGTLHLPSPTHSHSPRLDSLASLRQLRRSLSRSPSKTSRFSLTQGKSPAKSPHSPLSPLALSRAFTPRALASTDNVSLTPPSPRAEQPPTTTVTKKPKFPLRRTGTFIRSSPRTRSSPRSPKRRAFGEAANIGNATPTLSRRSSSGEENDLTPPGDSLIPQSEVAPKPSPFRFELNDGPIKFDFLRTSKVDSHPPVKSSPLKRSDGVMNLDHSTFGSPKAKRRSLHAATYGSALNIFSQGPIESFADQPGNHDEDKEMSNSPFSSPAPKKASPPRKSLSLRKSTLQQRHSQTPARPRTTSENSHQHEFAVPAFPASKARQRMSLDGALLMGSSTSQSPFRKPSSPFETYPFGSMPHRPSPAHQNRHPLANTHNAFHSSSPSFADRSQAEQVPPTPAPAARALRNTRQNQRPPVPGFSRSLPIGEPRPVSAVEQNESSAGLSFATPATYKTAKPLPTAFMSTGLISKKNRNAELPANESFTSYAMPDTPSKRNSFPPACPTPDRTAPKGRLNLSRHEFGTPSKPFSTYPGKSSPEAFGKSGIFGNGPIRISGLNRRSSFLSIDGDESHSPSKQLDGQSSADDLPPTPTKPTGAGRHSKENSLRSSLFGRRTSLGPDTFVPPPDADKSSPRPIRTSEYNFSPLAEQDSTDPQPLATFEATPNAHTDASGRTSPHTPQEKFMPPDPSTLSISGHADRRGSLFKSSTTSFPPATPTAPREQSFFGSTSVTGVTKNDVDETLTSRFGAVTLYGNGEFSQVYRVESPVDDLAHPAFSHAFKAVGNVWAVKKTKKPYTGNRDRENKRREAEILRTLRGHDHVINYMDSWEAHGHLYIQTEFCENGNLKDFLTQAGYKARLDDFRIWKILLELSMGLKYIHDSNIIHLDLKPANVFIDWEGVLKIGDFGLASTWPAPRNIDGEGDREYIGPEILSGRFDKPADIFALGMIVLEIAGNVVLPDNGAIWQRFRAGNLSDLPSLTWSSENSLVRNESGEPIESDVDNTSHETLLGSDVDDDSFKMSHNLVPRMHRPAELMNPPNFMVDPEDEQCLDKVVHWLINPEPDARPTIDQLYHCGGVQWVERRRRAGATIYEGNWGPSDDVLDHGQLHQDDVAMTDV